MIRLAQQRPGEWFIFHHQPNLEPIQIPTWIVELTPKEDRLLLARDLAQLFGLGRRIGRLEGQHEIKTALRELLE